MEIKATLEKPYTENERLEFIVENNHKLGFEIKETEEELQAWGYTEEEQAQQEAERIARLHLTRGDVFRGLLMAKGVTRSQIRAIIETMPEETEEQKLTKEMALIDFDEALDFYRGVLLIDTVGLQLGITPEQMTRFFETKDYHYLTNCTLSINAIPEEAIVTGEGTYPYGTVVDVKVECEGYIDYTQTLTLTENKTLNVELTPKE